MSPRYRLWRVSARRPGWDAGTSPRCSYHPTRRDAVVCGAALYAAGFDVVVERADATVSFTEDRP